MFFPSHPGELDNRNFAPKSTGGNFLDVILLCVLLTGAVEMKWWTLREKKINSMISRMPKTSQITKENTLYEHNGSLTSRLANETMKKKNTKSCEKCQTHTHTPNNSSSTLFTNSRTIHPFLMPPERPWANIKKKIGEFFMLFVL